MKRTIFSLLPLFLFVFIILLFCSCKKQDQQGTDQPTSSEPDSMTKQNLRILYVSNPGSDRAKDFEGFLSKHFATVKTGDLKAFRESDSEDFDVTILDYDGDGFKISKPQISPNFSRPVVTVGVMGGLLCSNLRLKTGYL
jgi:hypothetical protein